ncbi:RAS guanyl-releasing protein 1 [Acropora cervicornis]|uniref:RAS guanyl-releasing protein 1 n=1 Tax=Acropora cervicornis TaxID=6130 RepID=A0AAD9V426_ACRCE|nr:RAS guanyl-releasing protein 1 [Acropora cervicornis]
MSDKFRSSSMMGEAYKGDKLLTMDDKHDEVDGGVVSEGEHGRYPRAASLDKIVDFCAEEFACANVRNSAFSTERFLSNCVFMVHKWFLSSEELLTKFWISKYGLEFKKDVKLVSLLNQFSEIVDCKGDKSVIDNSNIVPAENEQTEPSMERKNSMAFKDISASTLAEQLTYLEYKMLRRVPFSELWTYVSTGKLKETTYLERYVALFNGVSRWLQGMVLNCVTPEERASCIEKFQQTAKHLKELQNFNGLMAVAGGLTSSPLSRLHQTQDLLSHDCKEFLKILMEFLSSDGNYAMYRKALGIQLKDLIALHTALPDSVDGNLINVQKMIRLATIVAPLLQVTLQTRLTDEELYELSLAREPRNVFKFVK